MVFYAVVAVSFIERSTALVMAAAVWEGRGDIFIVIYMWSSYVSRVLLWIITRTTYYARSHTTPYIMRVHIGV